MSTFNVRQEVLSEINALQCVLTHPDAFLYSGGLAKSYDIPLYREVRQMRHVRQDLRATAACA